MVKAILMLLIFVVAMPINLICDDLIIKAISAWAMFGSSFLSGIFLVSHIYNLNIKRQKEISSKIDTMHG